MSKGPKVTYIDTIIKLGKSPEKCTPSPLAYIKEKAWDNVHQRTIGGQKQRDERTTFVVEKETTANETPGFKYQAINTVSYACFNCFRICFTTGRLPLRSQSNPRAGTTKRPRIELKTCPRPTLTKRWKLLTIVRPGLANLR